MSTNHAKPLVAYLSAEIALDSAMPTYAGGLGVLAGDTVRSAADLRAPMVGISLLYRHGYFNQKLDASGQQGESPMAWKPEKVLKPLPPRITVEIEGRSVAVRAWLYEVRGATGGIVPVYLLDTQCPENAEQDRELTGYLYGGDGRMRLCQEVVLGLGGVRMLRALGHHGIVRFHMNEGHAALAAVALLEEKLGKKGRGHATPALVSAVRESCVFTTHTPVPAGHDAFPGDLASSVLGEARWALCRELGADGGLNMSILALKCSRFTNAVALKHAATSARDIFPGSEIHSITNGVHIPTWASSSMQALFDRHLAGWREDPLMLRYVIAAPDDEVWKAHLEAKQALVDMANRRSGAGFNRDVLTLGYARRITAYKRPMLLFEDLTRLKSMARYVGPLQIVYAGKAHPRDEEGKTLIRRVHDVIGALKGRVPVAFLENYDMGLAKQMVAGVDVWVNTPRPPMEASGTSGMKAAVNGVPSLSVLDGWWAEGHIEEVTGWAVGVGIDDTQNPAHDSRYATSLYNTLSKSILPMFYDDRPSFIRVMKNTIAHNATYFNTNRMVQQYLRFAYRLPEDVGE